MKRSLCAIVVTVLAFSTRAGADGVSVRGFRTGADLYSNGSAVGPISGSGSYVGPTWNIQAASVADYGTLGASVQGHRDNTFSPGDNSTNDAGAIASFEDHIHFSSGSGTFQVHIDLDGSLDIDGARFTDAGIDLLLRYGSFLDTVLHFERKLRWEDLPTTHLLVDEHLVSDPIPFNSTTDTRLVMNMLATVTLQGFAGDTPDASSDFMDTARVAYLEVRDAGGNLINPTAVGTSGHAYLVNVPEPSVACWAGVALVGLRRRRSPVADNRC